MGLHFFFFFFEAQKTSYCFLIIVKKKEKKPSVSWYGYQPRAGEKKSKKIQKTQSKKIQKTHVMLRSSGKISFLFLYDD
jgi:hypothetical protein